MAWRCKECRKFMFPSKILSSGLCISCSSEEWKKTAKPKPTITIAPKQDLAKKQAASVPSLHRPLQLYSELSAQEKMMIPQWYKNALECASIIDTTKSIEVFSQRYDLMLQNLTLIAEIEPRVCFTGMTVKERIEKLTSQRENLVSDFIVRDFNKVCEKAAKLKTERGRNNAMSRFFAAAELTASSYSSVSKTIKELHAHLAEVGLSPYTSAETSLLCAEKLCNFAIVYYKNGHVIDCVPRMPSNLYDEINRQIYYTATNIVVDGEEIDLTNADSIAQMPLVRFSDGELTTNLAYQLKMHAIRETDPNIAVILIPKAAELMQRSRIAWNERDYRRLAEQLYHVGRNSEAEEFIKKFKCSLADEEKRRNEEMLKRFNETLDLCRELETDLIEMSAHSGACEKCSKYQGRIFSVSGSHQNFPKLPPEVFIYGGIHEGCRHTFGPYIEGSPPVWSEEELAKL